MLLKWIRSRRNSNSAIVLEEEPSPKPEELVIHPYCESEEIARHANVIDQIMGGGMTESLGEPKGDDAYAKMVRCAETLRRRVVNSDRIMRELFLLDGASERERAERLHLIASDLSTSVGKQLDRIEKNAEENANLSEIASAIMMEVDQSTSCMTAAAVDLTSKIERISGILELIQGLSVQSKLLALNAAIEAARAKEYGKGFAVVAEEVQSMARQTESATDRIRQDLVSLSTTSESLVELVDMVRQKLSGRSKEEGQLSSSSSDDAAIGRIRTIHARSSNAYSAVREVGDRLDSFLRELRREPGVRDDAIIFAQSAGFEGVLAGLSSGINLGIRAAFDEVNRAGGIHGRKLILETMNDGFESDLMIKNVQEFLRRADGVFAFIGSCGSVPSIALAEIATSAGIPVFGPASGATLLRDPRFDFVFNCRTTFAVEAEFLVEEIVRRNPAPRLAWLYQADPGWHAIMSEFDAVLKRKRLELLANGPVSRPDWDVTAAAEKITPLNVEYVIGCIMSRPLVDLKKILNAAGQHGQIFASSFATAKELADGLGASARGTVRTQGLPFFEGDLNSPFVRSYRSAMDDAGYHDSIDSSSLEGYTMARIAIAGLEAAGSNPRRETVHRVLRDGLKIDLGEFQFRYSKDHNHGMTTTCLTECDDRGRWRRVN